MEGHNWLPGLPPPDTHDEIVRLQASTHGKLAFLDEVEFKCARCGATYWRRIEMKEHYSEVVEVEGVGSYALNPEPYYVYAPNHHRCGVVEPLRV